MNILITDEKKSVDFLGTKYYFCRNNQTVDAEIKIVAGHTESFRC